MVKNLIRHIEHIPKRQSERQHQKLAETQVQLEETVNGKLEYNNDGNK